jgi:isoquinoline 1-oxidoreductase beta subunit
LGGGFGRKFEIDFIVQAVMVAKSVAKPVKLIWAREEDIHRCRFSLRAEMPES